MLKMILSSVVVSWQILVGISELGAQEFPPPGDESQQYATETFLSGLQLPAGLFLAREEDGMDRPTLFFAESAAGVVKSANLADPQDSRTILTDFAVGAFSEFEGLEVGPWSISLLTPTKLIVCGGVNSLGAVYALPKDKAPQSAKQAEAWIGDRDANGTERLGMSAMQLGETLAFFAPGRPDSSVAIWRSTISANELSELEELAGLEPGNSSVGPVGLCLSPDEQRQFLLAVSPGDMGASTDRDSQLDFYVPTTARPVYHLQLGLFDVVGIAYSPAGQLYVIDMALAGESSGGVYRVDDALWEGTPACRVVKIAEVAHPTSLVFVDNNTLLVTSAGTDLSEKNGSILRIRGEF